METGFKNWTHQAVAILRVIMQWAAASAALIAIAYAPRVAHSPGASGCGDSVADMLWYYATAWVALLVVGTLAVHRSPHVHTRMPIFGAVFAMLLQSPSLHRAIQAAPKSNDTVLAMQCRHALRESSHIFEMGLFWAVTFALPGVLHLNVRHTFIANLAAWITWLNWQCPFRISAVVNSTSPSRASDTPPN